MSLPRAYRAQLAREIKRQRVGQQPIRLVAPPPPAELVARAIHIVDLPDAAAVVFRTALDAAVGRGERYSDAQREAAGALAADGWTQTGDGWTRGAA